MKKNVLLIHRSWFKHQPLFREVVSHCASFFLMDKHSADDPFAIMAALHLGPEAMLCSNDMFRSYSALLEDKDVRLQFFKWQFHRVMRHKAWEEKAGQRNIYLKVKKQILLNCHTSKKNGTPNF